MVIATKHETDGVLPVNEAQLRHVIRTEPGTFEVWAFPLIERDDLWWTLRVRLPGHARELLVVDALNAPRRWRQGNALLRFVVQLCGRDRIVNWNLSGVRPEHLFTRGQKRTPSKFWVFVKSSG